MSCDSTQALPDCLVGSLETAEGAMDERVVRLAKSSGCLVRVQGPDPKGRFLTPFVLGIPSLFPLHPCAPTLPFLFRPTLLPAHTHPGYTPSCPPTPARPCPSTRPPPTTINGTTAVSASGIVLPGGLSDFGPQLDGHVGGAGGMVAEKEEVKRSRWDGEEVTVIVPGRIVRSFVMQQQQKSKYQPVQQRWRFQQQQQQKQQQQSASAPRLLPGTRIDITFEGSWPLTCVSPSLPTHSLIPFLLPPPHCLFRPHCPSISLSSGVLSAVLPAGLLALDFPFLPGSDKEREGQGA
ncbi:unnamed protein product [Closterium sp. Naga37s-1]|nr:unnamed protein product [Closterium sp. Naga37s-1]